MDLPILNASKSCTQGVQALNLEDVYLPTTSQSVGWHETGNSAL
jgi:hypothetical protein